MAVRSETVQVTGIRCERCVNRLAGGFEEPETAGYGDVLPDDPGLSAEQEAIRTGVTPAPEERVRVREEMEHPEKELGSSPGMLGDRIRER